MSSDWILEIGPEAGSKGGKVVAEGTPHSYKKKKTETAKFLFARKQIFEPIKFSKSTKRLHENQMKHLRLLVPMKTI